MLRLLAAVIFTAVGGIIGGAMAERLRTSRQRCDCISALIRRLNFLIAFRSDDVYSVCRQLKSDTELGLLKFVEHLPTEFSPEIDFRECWISAVESQPDLEKDESEILLRIGGILGKSDVQGQQTGLNELQKELDRMTEVRVAELAKKGRLYRSAGLLMGAMAGILVI